MRRCLRAAGRRRDKEPIDSFPVITTEPNAPVAPIHDRMLVILDPADYDTWLPAGLAIARALLRA